MSKMKKSITLSILEKLNDMAMSSSELLEVFLSAPYGTSISGFDYRLRKKRSARKNSKEEEAILKQRFYSFVYKLGKDGLIQKRLGKKGNIFAIMPRGIKKLLYLREKAIRDLPLPNYEKRDGNKFIIVTFDIPEKERRKRAWLRSALKNLGLKMVQKSVWIGKAKIPEEFLDDLKNLKLVSFIEIFEITKTGSLQHLL